MVRIFIAAVESQRDRMDLDRSVGAPIERQLIIRNFSDATYPELIDIERRGHGFYAWGLRATPQNIENWFLMSVGDFVLIAQKGSFRQYAKVLGRYENAKAARAIWGAETPDDEVREYLFFLSEPIALGLPCDELADYLQVDPGDFSRVPDEAMDRIEADFGNVERFARRRLLNTAVGGPILDMSGMIRVSERDMARMQLLEPQNSKDGRQAVIDTIIKRRGHPDLPPGAARGLRVPLRDHQLQCAGRPGGDLHRAVQGEVHPPSLERPAPSRRHSHPVRPRQDRHRHRHDVGRDDR